MGNSQDRGSLACGCALDINQLLKEMQIVRASLASGADLVILNTFGKTVAEGAGFRLLTAEAIEATLPLLIAVPWRNIESWRNFTGEMALEIDLEHLAVDGPSLCDSLGVGHLGEGREHTAPPPSLISTRHGLSTQSKPSRLALDAAQCRCGWCDRDWPPEALQQNVPFRDRDRPCPPASRCRPF